MIGIIIAVIIGILLIGWCSSLKIAIILALASARHAGAEQARA